MASLDFFSLFFLHLYHHTEKRIQYTSIKSIKWFRLLTCNVKFDMT